MIRPSGCTAKAFGAKPPCTLPMICSVCVSTMYTVVLLVEMNNRVPSGETRTTNGFPAGVKIVDTCWDEATSITPTFWSHWLVTYAVPPSGEKATPVGQLPVG